MCGFQETLPTKEPQAFEDIKMNEVMLSVGIYHPRKVSAICGYMQFNLVNNKEMLVFPICTWVHDGVVCLVVSRPRHTAQAHIGHAVSV